MLGEGASKKVYFGWDGVEKIDIAWNKIDEEEEAILLKSLNHERVTKCFGYWFDSTSKTVNMIAELCPSGSLKEVRRSSIGTSSVTMCSFVEGEYNELVDVYAFGMCLLEMVTGECSNQMQVFKKVFSRRGEGYYRQVSVRPSAEELLKDPFFLYSDASSKLSLATGHRFRGLHCCARVVAWTRKKSTQLRLAILGICIWCGDRSSMNHAYSSLALRCVIDFLFSLYCKSVTYHSSASLRY
ncbi:hypothetical protein CQW23_24944 [Capsicum baccatum]|uniref:non-specific serine/threonine protein kinase n=1 Tax=Capsicum baccatum TaxID=33114 RepID=A0A2G2VW97_CAPBA|nr:hypothetical protein CQW23_24944 [Capsicum baccatum]